MPKHQYSLLKRMKQEPTDERSPPYLNEIAIEQQLKEKKKAMRLFKLIQPSFLKGIYSVNANIQKSNPFTKRVPLFAQSNEGNRKIKMVYFPKNNDGTLLNTTA